MKKKLFAAILLVLVLLVLSAIGIFVLRAFDSSFRYSFDVNFNNAKEHKSYSEDLRNFTTLPLPPSTAFAFRHSDTAVTYYTKLNYDEFIKYYKDNGYTVNENVITHNNVNFIIIYKNYEGSYKYNFIEIDLFTRKLQNNGDGSC